MMWYLRIDDFRLWYKERLNEMNVFWDGDIKILWWDGVIIDLYFSIIILIIR